jgi:nicotinate-nucleotide adenylyltransferase
MRIGIMGGSFNPAHDGHRHISVEALARLGLDQVWWLVSPQNPLKSEAGMASYERRFATALAKSRHPRILVTDLETRLGTRYTFDTLTQLKRLYSRTHFVWLMGADNLGQIHQWQRWRGIFGTVPIAVFDRPPYRFRTLAAPAAAAFARHRQPSGASRRLADMAPPAWIFFLSRLDPLSSTEIRARARRMSLTSLRSRRAIPMSLENAAPKGSPIITEADGGMMPAEPLETTSPVDAKNLSPDQLRDAVVKVIDDDKGEDIVVVDLEGKSNLADYIVIATGRSARQVGAMADHLLRQLQPKLAFRMAVEGLPQGDWALIDCGDVVVHLFRPEVRDFYAIETMWGLETPTLSAQPNLLPPRPALNSP